MPKESNIKASGICQPHKLKTLRQNKVVEQLKEIKEIEDKIKSNPYDPDNYIYDDNGHIEYINTIECLSNIFMDYFPHGRFDEEYELKQLGEKIDEYYKHEIILIGEIKKFLNKKQNNYSDSDSENI